MATKLDAQRIESARKYTKKSNNREEEKKHIRETIAKNRSGERKGRIIIPEKKLHPKESTPKTRVAAYCRVSTAEEAQVGSFEMQVQHFQALIESNPCYELVKIYTDEGVSGTQVKKRQGFRALIDDAVAGKIDLILTKSISRFGRNIVDILNTLRKLESLKPPVAVIFESEGINTSDSGNKLIISILSALAELESQQKSIAIKEGIRYRMQEGLYKFSVRNMLGYYRDYSGRIRIEPAEAEIVHFIYDSYVEGASIQAIADTLSKQRILSPRGLEYWAKDTVRAILQNEKYCGDVLYQKFYTKDYLTHRVVHNRDDLPQWYWENNHPAIISREQWEQVQTIIAAKHPKRRKRGQGVKQKFTAARVESGALQGYYLLDLTWSKKQRMQFLSLTNLYQESEEKNNTTKGI